jgi:hypothetical protein
MQGDAAEQSADCQSAAVWASATDQELEAWAQVELVHPAQAQEAPPVSRGKSTHLRAQLAEPPKLKRGSQQRVVDTARESAPSTAAPRGIEVNVEEATPPEGHELFLPAEWRAQRSIAGHHSNQQSGVEVVPSNVSSQQVASPALAQWADRQERDVGRGMFPVDLADWLQHAQPVADAHRSGSAAGMAPWHRPPAQLIVELLALPTRMSNAAARKAAAITHALLAAAAAQAARESSAATVRLIAHFAEVAAKHRKLYAALLAREHDFPARLKALLDGAAADGGTYASGRDARRHAAAQLRLGVFCALFWAELERRGVRQSTGGGVNGSVYSAVTVAALAQKCAQLALERVAPLPGVPLWAMMLDAAAVAAARRPLSPPELSVLLWSCGKLRARGFGAAALPDNHALRAQLLARAAATPLRGPPLTGALEGLAHLGALPSEAGPLAENLLAGALADAECPAAPARFIAMLLHALAHAKLPLPDAHKAALTAAAERAARALNHISVAMALFAFAELDMPFSGDLADAYIAAALRTLPAADAQSVSTSLYALGRLGAPHTPELARAAAAAAARTAESLDAQGLPNLALGLAKLRIRLEGWEWGEVHDAARRLAPELTPQGIACTLHGFASVHASDDREVGMYLFRPAIARTAPEMAPEEVSMTLCALANLFVGLQAKVLHDGGCRVALVQAARRTLPRMDPSSAARSLSALARLLVPLETELGAPVLREAAERVAAAGDAAHISMVLRALARSGPEACDPVATDTMLAAAETALPAMELASVVRVLWAAAACGRASDDLVAAAASAARSCARKVAPHDAACAFMALVQLRVPLDGDIGAAVLGLVRRAALRMRNDWAVHTLWALAMLRARGGGGDGSSGDDAACALSAADADIVALLLAALRYQGCTLQARNVAVALWALATLRAPVDALDAGAADMLRASAKQGARRMARGDARLARWALWELGWPIPHELKQQGSGDSSSSSGSDAMVQQSEIESGVELGTVNSGSHLANGMEMAAPDDELQLR